MTFGQAMRHGNTGKLLQMVGYSKAMLQGQKMRHGETGAR